MKIVLVRSRSTDPSVDKLAEALHRGGHLVTLLVWDRLGGENFEDNKNYTVRKFRLDAPQDTPLVFLYLPLWWLYEFVFLLRNDCEVIHACDLDTVLPAIVVGTLKKRKLCYTIFDFYSSNFPDRVPRFVSRTVASLERCCAGFTDCLFLVDKSRYCQVHGARIRRLEYIYNSPPDRCGDGREVKQEFVTTVFYGGVIHKTRGLEDIIRALSGIADVQLWIAGSGPETESLRTMAAEISANVRFLGFLDYDDILDLTIEADIIIALYDPAIENSRYASPNKLFEAMMARKPIIVNEESGASTIVKTNNSGLVVRYGDIDSIKRAIILLKNNEHLRMELGRNGREAYEKEYSWERMERRLLSAYGSLRP